MTHRLLLSLAAAMLLTGTMPSYSAERKKKKKVVVDDYYANLPQPDEPMPALTPQPHLGEVLVAGLKPLLPTQLRSAHTANRNIGGIDVSHYQGSINWREVAKERNILYAYIKATEGTNLVDNTYHTNLRGARKAGLRVGAYHFFNPNANAREQFRNFSTVVKLKEQDLIPIIDIEHRGKSPLPEFRNRLKQFLQMVERHYGVRPILYTSRDFYNKYLSGPFTHYKYMIARYHPDIPQLCDNAAFVMWQYSATSRIRGIRGNVDRSCMMDNYTLSDILIR